MRFRLQGLPGLMGQKGDFGESGPAGPRVIFLSFVLSFSQVSDNADADS